MKLIWLAFIGVSLALTFVVVVETKMAEEEKAKESTGPSLMDVIHGILNDPEFLALSDEDQLKVLIMIYTFLESRAKNGKRMMKRDVSESNGVFSIWRK